MKKPTPSGRPVTDTDLRPPTNEEVLERESLYELNIAAALNHAAEIRAPADCVIAILDLADPLAYRWAYAGTAWDRGFLNALKERAAADHSTATAIVVVPRDGAVFMLAETHRTTSEQLERMPTNRGRVVVTIAAGGVMMRVVPHLP